MDLSEDIISTGLKHVDPSLYKDRGPNGKTGLPDDFRLIYVWHKSEYIGGAHGYFGILYMLLAAMQILSPDFIKKPETTDKLRLWREYIFYTIKFLVNGQQSTGNFPSNVAKIGKGAPSDTVQFCHGSPGAVACLLKAAEVFTNHKDYFLQSAVRACENIWNQGLCKKGWGLCHGITGNAYAFLSMYRFPGELPNREEYLAKGVAF
jgi:hypothetical protein